MSGDEAKELLTKHGLNATVIIALIGYAAIGIWYSSAVHSQIDQLTQDVLGIKNTLRDQNVDSRLKLTEQEVGQLQESSKQRDKLLIEMQALDHAVSDRLISVDERQRNVLLTLEHNAKHMDDITNGIQNIIELLHRRDQRSQLPPTAPY